MFRRIDDDMRAAMAIDWIAREKENPGRNTYSNRDMMFSYNGSIEITP